MELLKIFRKVFDGEQNCSPCLSLKRKLTAAEVKLQLMQRTIEDLSAGKAPQFCFQTARNSIIETCETYVYCHCCF